GALKRLAHVPGDRAGDHQNVGMPWRGNEAQPEALEIIEGVVERVNLQLAAVAGTSIDLADRQTAAEPAPCHRVKFAGELRQRRMVSSRRRFGERPAQHALKQSPSHLSALSPVAHTLHRHRRACVGHPRLGCYNKTRQTWMPAPSSGMTEE